MLKERERFDVAELLAKATQPAATALQLHPFYRGKIETALMQELGNIWLRLYYE